MSNNSQNNNDNPYSNPYSSSQGNEDYSGYNANYENNMQNNQGNNGNVQYTQGNYNGPMSDGMYSGAKKSGFGGVEKAIDTNIVLYKSFGFMFLALIVSMISGYVIQVAILNGIIPIRSLMVVLITSFVFEFIVLLAAQSVARKNQVVPAAILFFLYALLNGTTFAVVFLLYVSSSVVIIFGVTAVVFGICALFGFITKINLQPFAAFFMVALIGMIIVGFAAVLFSLPQLQIFTCIFGVLIFAGLTAFDVQRIKHMSEASTGISTTGLGILGGLTLYLDFVNIFLKLLRLFGRSK